jgi:hypothetical protein
VFINRHLKRGYEVVGLGPYPLSNSGKGWWRDGPGPRIRLSTTTPLTDILSLSPDDKTLSPKVNTCNG